MTTLIPVLRAAKRSGSGGIGGTGRKTSWWDCTLACGHIMERGHGNRPAPKRTRCDFRCTTNSQNLSQEKP